MAKGKNDTSPAADYIEQLEWQAQHYRRYVPARFLPKWKYKIVYRTPPPTPFDRIAGWGFFLIVVSIVIYFLSSAATGEKFFWGTIMGLILGIIFFAVRDASKKQRRKSDDPDS